MIGATNTTHLEAEVRENKPKNIQMNIPTGLADNSQQTIVIRQSPKAGARKKTFLAAKVSASDNILV